MNFLKNLLIFCLVSVHFTLIAEITESIIPFFNSLENIELFEEKKYGSHMMAHIKYALSHPKQKIRICSYNLFLYDGDDDNFPSALKIQKRIPRIVIAIKEMDADLIAVQGCFEKHLNFLIDVLKNDYTFYGEKNHWGNAEINGFFYKKKRFILLEKETFRILTDEEIHSDEDIFYHTAAKIRVYDHQTQSIFDVYNGHLDFMSAETRQAQAQKIVNHISKEFPTVVCGSFNTFPNFPDQPFPAFDGERVLNIFKQNSFLHDSRTISIIGNMGSSGTFTNDPDDLKAEAFKGNGSPEVVLDHLLCSPHFIVIKRAINPIKVDGFHPSEHQPVIVDLIFDNQS